MTPRQRSTAVLSIRRQELEHVSRNIEHDDKNERNDRNPPRRQTIATSHAFVATAHRVLRALASDRSYHDQPSSIGPRLCSKPLKFTYDAIFLIFASRKLRTKDQACISESPLYNFPSRFQHRPFSPFHAPCRTEGSLF
jgi:hypothetical protein